MDLKTGLVYFGARYYDSDVGRFLNQDSYRGDPKSPPSLHRYLYAHSNPTYFIDPDGHFIFTATAVAVGSYLAWKAGESAVETGIEAGIAKVTDDKGFSTGKTFIKNMAVNSTLGLIPGASEAKIGVKAAKYAAEIALRTTADTIVDASTREGSVKDHLVNNLVGNLAGDAIGAGVKKYGGKLVGKVKTFAGKSETAIKASETSTLTKESYNSISALEKSTVRKIEKPTDPYSPDWTGWYKQNPGHAETINKSLGSAGKNFSPTNIPKVDSNDYLASSNRLQNKIEAWRAYKADPNNSGWDLKRWSKQYDQLQINRSRGKWAESFGQPGATYHTPYGRRIVDNDPATEIKTGYQSAKKFIRRQIIKDSYLKRTLPDYNPVWKFTDREPSKRLLEKLKTFGIRYELPTRGKECLNYYQN